MSAWVVCTDGSGGSGWRSSSAAPSPPPSVRPAAWSMQPDHGAAIVRAILSSDELTDTWPAELDAMRVRIASLRAALACAATARST